MSGDSHSRISADDLDLFGSGGVEDPETPREDEWSADAPPLPFMNPAPGAGTDGAPTDRLLSALPWIKRAG